MRVATRSTGVDDQPGPGADRDCAPERAGAGLTQGPSIETSARSFRSATSPTVKIPLSRSLTAVTRPTPQRLSTGSGWRKRNSPPGGTDSSPSGLATRLATLARNLVRATPTVIGRPTRSRTWRRSRTAMSSGVPVIRARPPTLRKASSIEIPSTRGVVSSKIANTALLASEYAVMRGGTTTASGHNRRAAAPPIAVRIPRAFAS